MFGVGEISAGSPHARIRLIFRGFSLILLLGFPG